MGAIIDTLEKRDPTVAKVKVPSLLSSLYTSPICSAGSVLALLYTKAMFE
jgi:hypothetical protein